jgi:hypothetical protein
MADEVRKIKIEADRPTRGRPKEVKILGGHEVRTEQVQRLSQTQETQVLETFDSQNPPPQPETDVDVEIHGTQRAFKEETRK